MKNLKVLVLLFTVSFYAKAQQPAAAVPAFTFFKFDKTAFTNKNLAPDKQLFFVFFDVTCDHCQHALQYINTNYAAFTKPAIYIITLDSEEKVKAFFLKEKINLGSKKNVTLLKDVNNEFIKKFGPRKYPSIFLYSKKQQLLLYSDDEKKLNAFSELMK